MLHLKEKIKTNKTGFKGVGNILQEVSSSNSVNNTQWGILKGNISLPAATLSDSAIKHNSLWMKKFSESFDFLLAPHGKTTMLPELFQLQLQPESGCWGITLATAYQVAVAFNSGVKRTIMANQLVGECNMDIISSILKEDPTFEFICLVDSSENVSQLGQFFSERKQKINVLLEYGPLGGRTGIRNVSQENDVLIELRKWKNAISLVGIEFFEGILKNDNEIRDFIKWCLSRVSSLKEEVDGEEFVITGAGTSWLDVVAEEFVEFEKNSSTVRLKKVLRSGCYLIYDAGMYAKMEQRVLAMKLRKHNILSKGLKPALNIWAYVHSIPEPNLAIIGMGRRDSAMDCGFPVPRGHYRSKPQPPEEVNDSNTKCAMPVGHQEGSGFETWEVFNMMDQHTFMRIRENTDIKVGDIIMFDIYHACTNMDKWRNILLVDDQFNVIDILHPNF